MLVQEISPIQEFNDSIFFNGKEKELFKRDCPHCHSEKVEIHFHYNWLLYFSNLYPVRLSVFNQAEPLQILGSGK